jgi:radical SAM protein with 4Fe4S-binding SPASM domain
MEAPSARYGELPVGEVVKLIDQFEKANVLEVTLTGGEPFVREDLLDILDVLVEKRIRVNRIYSNGTLIHEGILEAIRRRGFSPGFQISFDGCNAHDQMRRTKGIEQSVIKAIQTLCACGFETSVATCIDRLNKDRLLATFDLLNTFDIQFWRITSPQRVGYWRDSSTALSQEEEMEAYLPVLHRWLEEGRPFGLQLGKFFITGMGKRGDSLQPHRMRFTPDSYDCSDLRNRSYLLPDGVLIPCPGFTDANFRKRMPNLFKEELSKVWSQSFLCYIIDMKKGDLLAHNKECERCKIFQDCGLGCRASAVAETGDLMKKDPIACSMWKRGYKQRFLDLGSSAPTG